jgi:hypothetical protein
LKVTALKDDLDGFPGWVTFMFTDIFDKEWTVTEKLPVVGLEYPVDENEVPFEFQIETKILESYFDETGKEIYKIEFLYDIESDDGEIVFTLYASKV